MPVLHWFRVELDAGGKILSVRLVPERAAADHVFYIQAANKDQAGRLAYNEYSRRKVAADRANRRKQGRCRCGRPRDSRFLQCGVCRVRGTADKKRMGDRRAGRPVQEADRIASSAERTRDRRAELRLETLVEVRTAWTDKDARSFGNWLNGEIEAITGRKVA